MAAKYNKRRQVRLTPKNTKLLKAILRDASFIISLPVAANRALELGLQLLAKEISSNGQ